MANENKVKTRIKKLLESHGWFTWAVPQNAFGTGVADRNALRKGVFLAVEAKSKTGNTVRKLTTNQARYLEAVNAEDSFGFVVSEDTLEAFETWLVTFDRCVEAASKGKKPAPEDGAANLEAIRLLTEPIVAAIQNADFAATGGRIKPA